MATSAAIGSARYIDGSIDADTVASASGPPCQEPSVTNAMARNAASSVTVSAHVVADMEVAASVSTAASCDGRLGTFKPPARASSMSSCEATIVSTNATPRNTSGGANQATAMAKAMGTGLVRG